MTGGGMEAWRRRRRVSAPPDKASPHALSAILIEKYEALKE
jgi:hypothetical protein